MSRFKDFPHPIINVKDESIVDVFVTEEIPLHLPLFLSYSGKGIPNKIEYGTKSELENKIGAGVFDEFSPYFKHPNLFMRMAAQNQRVFHGRLVPDDAETASIVLEAHVKDTDILQWQRDGSGRYLLDGEGEKVPTTLINNMPTLDNLNWDDNDHESEGTYGLTINCSDIENDIASYQLTCNDANVVITQDPNDDNVFSVTYPVYVIETLLTYTATITDTFGNVLTITEDIDIIDVGAQLVFNDVYVNNSVYYFENSYTVKSYMNSLEGSPTYTQALTCTDPNVTITPVTETQVGEWIVTLPIGTTVETFDFSIGGNDSINTITKTFSFITNTYDPAQSTRPGIMIMWKQRPLLITEDKDLLVPVTYVEGPDTITNYPIFTAIPNAGPGIYGNNIGIQTWWDADIDLDVISDNETMMFKMKLMDKPYGIDTPQAIRDSYDKLNNDFAFNPETIDNAVAMRMDFDSIMNNLYKSDNPFEYKLYTDNIAIINNRVLPFELPFTPELTSHWMVNVLEAVTTDQVPYYCTEIDITSTEATLMEKDVTHYMEGGLDGTLSDDNLESLTSIWVAGEVFPEMRDYARYPFNHFYDSGYSLDTKIALFNLLDIRESVHIIMSTQDINNEWNTKAQDQSAGSALRTAALLYLESTLYGTQNMRVTIFQQCGLVNFSDTYQETVPYTLKALYDRATMHNSDYVKKEWKGLPNASIDLFKSINWSPYNDDFKQLSWDTGLNYAQYYDMTRLHYPDIITIYPFHTSLLLSDTLATYICYMKQTVRRVWAEYAGIEETAIVLGGKIKIHLDSLFVKIFKNYVDIEVMVYQTDQDADLGYALTVELDVYDSHSKRVWNVPIKIRRSEDKEV